MSTVPTSMVDFLGLASESSSKWFHSEKKGRISFQASSFLGTVPVATDKTSKTSSFFGLLASVWILHVPSFSINPVHTTVNSTFIS